MITLKLDPQDINFIQQILGELPTKTGCFPLLVKIKEQADAQTQRDVPPPPMQ
jgi:hypothetical protein